MDEVPDAREIPAPTLAAMVRRIDPNWELQSAAPVERGFCSVYRVEVAAGEGTRTLYLKASPDGQPWAIPTEARIQAVLNEQTSIPVPEVLGVVDGHETLPAPYYLMTALPGEELPYEAVGRLDDDTLRRLAQETGAYLGELHSVPAPDQFGHVRHDDTEADGGRPGDTPAVLTVGTAHDHWADHLAARVEQALDRHEDSHFATLTPELEEWFRDGIDRLQGPFDPALGRNDHGLHNLLVDSGTGRITGLIDWGYTLSVPPAFDVEFAVYLYSGAFLAGLPDVADRRSLVREALLSGYRRTAPDLAERVSTPEPLYEALAMVRIMNDFDHLELPDGTEQAVMERIRADVRELIE